MKNLHHSLKELTREECTLINGGDGGSGWFYLGRRIKMAVYAINRWAADMQQNSGMSKSRFR